MKAFLSRDGIRLRYYATKLGIDCLENNFSICTPEKLHEIHQKLSTVSGNEPVEISELEYTGIIKCLKRSLTGEDKREIITQFKLLPNEIYIRAFMTEQALQDLSRDITDSSGSDISVDFITKYWDSFERGWISKSYRDFLKFFMKIQKYLRPKTPPVTEIPETTVTPAFIPETEGILAADQTREFVLHGELYPHQIRAIEWMADREATDQHGFRGGILSLTQGLGKTLTSLTYALQNRGEFPQLVIVNKAVMPEWRKSIRTFYPDLERYVLFMHADYSDVSFSAITRQQLMKYQIVITTYGMVRNAVELVPIAKRQTIALGDPPLVFGKLNISHLKLRTKEQANDPRVIGKGILVATPWHRVICDESQVFANPDTKIFKAIMTVYGQYKWCLTGTPIRNYETDLYSQFRYCGFDILQAQSVKEWKTFIKYNGYNEYQLNHWILTMNYEDANIVLPEKIRRFIPLDFHDPREQTTYNYVLESAKVIYDEVLKNKLRYASLLAALVRLRQCCVSCYAGIAPPSKKGILEYEGMVTLGTEEREIIEDAPDLTEWIIDPMGTAGIQSTKNRELVRLVTEEIPRDEKVIVFSMFVTLLSLGKKAIETADETIACFMIHGGLSGAQRDMNLEQFKSFPGKAVLFVNYKVGSEGLNITEANHIIPLEPWWNYSTHAQAESRAWRMGQTKPVYIYDIIIKDTVESHVLGICERKREMAGNFLGTNDSIAGDTTRLSDDVIGDMLGVFRK